MECNIDQRDRTNRIVIGVLLLIGVLLGWNTFFMFLLGVILIVEGVIGWCGIPLLVAKIKELTGKS